MSQLLPPSNLTALAALPAVALDLETTGLDVRRDRVVQVGAVVLSGARILDAQGLDQKIDPEVPVPAAATRIHGLADSDLAGAPRFADFAPALRELLAGHVVIGHQIAFDLAVLRHEAARAGIPWREPLHLDLALLVGALEPALPAPDLETVASRLGVVIHGRHTAHGDAMAAAQAFAALIPKLRQAGIRTLGEARSLSQRRRDLVQKQAEAGWHEKPQDGREGAQPEPARLDGYVFERRIADVMRAPAVLVPAHVSLADGARLMTERRIGALLVGAAARPPQGIVTERDVLRVVAAGSTDLRAATMGDVMTTPVECMEADELLYRALGRMDRRSIRHLCVVDGHGRAVGMVSQRDLLRHRARSALAPGDAIAEAEDAASLAAAYGQIPEVAARLVAEGIGGVEVARVVSSEICALSKRAAELAVARLAEELGPVPAPWSLLVLGSGGRGESLLSADQDNALIHAGSSADDPWFAAMGEAVAAILHEAGVPRCMGGVMAANAPWRGTVAEWNARIEGWLRRARPDDLLNVDIFFDLKHVAGDEALARRLHTDAVVAASRSLPFIALLAQSVSTLSPVFGLFGRPRTSQGRIDLKREGLLPVVGLARTLALRIGSTVLSTPDRLRDAAAAGRLPAADAERLVDIHASLMKLVLQQQLADLEEGVRPSSRVLTQPLGRQRWRELTRQLHRIDEILRSLRAAVAG
ncbi:MAG: DUF294 nucleotidyltransferase-like domain-containing protein [Burkholderiales bacterium]